jgi:hypothetical protein
MFFFGAKFCENVKNRNKKKIFLFYLNFFVKFRKCIFLVIFGLWFSYSNFFLTSFFQSSIFLNVKKNSPINVKFLLRC